MDLLREGRVELLYLDDEAKELGFDLFDVL